MQPPFSRLSVALIGLMWHGLWPCYATAAPQNPTLQANENALFSRPLQGEKRVAHLLNRLAFGPRPGELESVARIGAGAWIETQLAPQKINDSALETSLYSFAWLRETPARLMLAYESDTAGFIRRSKKAGGEIQTENLKPRQQELLALIEAAKLPPRASVEALGQLSSDKIARAIDSKRQLQEVLTDFWGNHFNLDVKKGPVRALKIVDDRGVIRPHVFGTFRELLGASAHSPAMLVYLDNARSTKEFGAGRGKKRGGLNENYARELMELHTLGVDGGYTQKDVTEVARAFTGWGWNKESGEFVFRARAHDAGEKTVLGQPIPAGEGEKDGERVLDLLAQSPATAHFIARKLCVRFVADNPPAALVSKVAAAFQKSNGDLKTTYRTLFFAPEFFSAGAYRAKIKSPFEFTVSSVRALGGTFDFTSRGAAFRILATGNASLNQGNNAGKNKASQGAKRLLAKRALATQISGMGQPLFSCQPPTGYSENSAKWVSASALVARLNFALDLTANRVGDVSLAPDSLRPAPVTALAQEFLHSDLSLTTRATIEAESQKTPDDGARLRSLLLGSPEFQRR
ncbi:putative conserved protein, DUF1800 family [Abditibacterium utsteinense]|uniref:Putative conserved protein, DUF1800 family n=1 Tax=Abditibacterium utsteinense TaxID=1960156 RepID=A0A2S8SXI4_9BACT|nr:DUF1800 domain-containing protein [Abditibacterium utsteinense]PQV65513.1 putative conserved protein, DUF1800 family [Abditibacterium utsteinense]